MGLILSLVQWPPVLCCVTRDLFSVVLQEICFPLCYKRSVLRCVTSDLFSVVLQAICFPLCYK